MTDTDTSADTVLAGIGTRADEYRERTEAAKRTRNRLEAEAVDALRHGVTVADVATATKLSERRIHQLRRRAALPPDKVARRLAGLGQLVADLNAQDLSADETRDRLRAEMRGAYESGAVTVTELEQATGFARSYVYEILGK